MIWDKRAWQWYWKPSDMALEKSKLTICTWWHIEHTAHDLQIARMEVWRRMRLRTFENVDMTSGQADQWKRWGNTVSRRQTVQDGISTSTSDHAWCLLNRLWRLGNLLVRKQNRSRSPWWLMVDSAPNPGSRIQMTVPNAPVVHREGLVGRGWELRKQDVLEEKHGYWSHHMPLQLNAQMPDAQMPPTGNNRMAYLM